MSQAKVDAYKKSKANRKETMKKEKTASILRTVVGCLVAVCILGWAGFSAVSQAQAKENETAIDINYDAINDYLQTVQ